MKHLLKQLSLDETSRVLVKSWSQRVSPKVASNHAAQLFRDRLFIAGLMVGAVILLGVLIFYLGVFLKVTSFEKFQFWLMWAVTVSTALSFESLLLLGRSKDGAGKKLLVGPVSIFPSEGSGEQKNLSIPFWLGVAGVVVIFLLILLSRALPEGPMFALLWQVPFSYATMLALLLWVDRLVRNIALLRFSFWSLLGLSLLISSVLLAANFHYDFSQICGIVPAFWMFRLDADMAVWEVLALVLILFISWWKRGWLTAKGLPVFEVQEPEPVVGRSAVEEALRKALPTHLEGEERDLCWLMLKILSFPLVLSAAIFLFDWNGGLVGNFLLSLLEGLLIAVGAGVGLYIANLSFYYVYRIGAGRIALPLGLFPLGAKDLGREFFERILRRATVLIPYVALSFGILGRRHDYDFLWSLLTGLLLGLGSCVTIWLGRFWSLHMKFDEKSNSAGAFVRVCWTIFVWAPLVWPPGVLLFIISAERGPVDVNSVLRDAFGFWLFTSLVTAVWLAKIHRKKVHTFV